MGNNNKKWLDDGKENSRNFPQGQRVYSPDGNSAQLTSQGGGWGAKTGLYEIRPVLTPDRKDKRQNGRRMKENGEPSFSLTAQDQHGVAINKRIRRLTPVECARLQGFPDNWCEGLSDSAQYRCYGNAVTVDIVEMIAKRLKGNDEAQKTTR